MADQRTPFLSVDLDTGGGTERGQAINLVRRASGGSTEIIGNTTAALSLPVTMASDQGAIEVDGGLTHDNAAPAATQQGVLVALANAAAPTYTETNQVLLSVDLSGALRVSGGGGGTEYTTDVAGGAGPWVGGIGVNLRDDGLSTQETTDGDYTPSRANARGALWVELDPTNAIDVSGATVTIAGAVTTEFASSTAVAAMADADANPTVLPIGSYAMGYNGTTWDRLRSAIATGLEVDIVQSVSLAVTTELPAAAALTDDFATPTAPAVGAHMMVYDGSAWDMARGTSTTGLEVDIVQSVALDISAGATLTPGVGATDLGSAIDTAVGATDTGVAALAQRVTTPGAITPANGDWTPLMVDDNGRLHVTDPNAGAGTPTTPILVEGSATDLAAGSSTTTDIQTAESGAATWKMTQATAWSSVAYKMEIMAVDNAVETVIATLGGQAFSAVVWEPAHKDYGEHVFTAQAGFDGFRVVITNLDDSLAADVHGSISYEL